MKKKLITLIVITLISCSSVLEKKYEKLTKDTDLNQIYELLSKQDFEILKNHITELEENGSKLDGKTYQTILSEAIETNHNKQQKSDEEKRKSLSNLDSQDCYSDETIKYSHKNFSDLWFIDYNYNGTIGNDNKRIEMHITKTEKINDTKYRVIGKSRTGNNINDFEGYIKINEIGILNGNNIACEGPDYPYCRISGKYSFNENANQKYSGKFEGEFTIYTQDEYFHPENYSDDWLDSGIYKNSNFLGVWKSYSKGYSKYCSWSNSTPHPSKNNDLFKPHENETYFFNPKYLNKGGKTYVIDSRIRVLKDFYSKNTGVYNDDFIEFSEIDKELSNKTETLKWWK
ncbi:hypothetical protein F7644_11600 [Tenacibaculum finnmarkense genomovar ulcerans]|uniref:hypothetical protein n=1 Tax=Tenacibaculum finnmarkense TaxID=2781243 RepID=UPI00187B9338|nr:hypothetical protein [Tenacibaculum finnmarkense]MBE7646622.1 hypothetical protein [Tenacibaculum finnmarkense genomovar ulcerans]